MQIDIAIFSANIDIAIPGARIDIVIPAIPGARMNIAIPCARIYTKIYQQCTFMLSWPMKWPHGHGTCV